MTTRWWIWSLIFFALSCSDSAPAVDATVDATVDTTVAADASFDFGLDAVADALPPDAMIDAVIDAVTDGGADTVFSHPAGWNAGAVHGAAFMGNATSCATCHGQQLEGGTALSCESCHSGWKTNCVFCHGGLNDQTGAPPHDLSGNTLTTVQSVGQHSEHVSATSMHVAFDCDTCHTKPVDALSSGHVGPSPAEVNFSGVAAGGSYDTQTGQCTVYCHGNGLQTTTAVGWTTSLTLGNCSGCHDDESDGAGIKMSGAHKFHVFNKKYGCYQCHFCVVDNTKTIIHPEFHINGETNVCGAANWTASTQSCTPYCHAKKNWY